MMGVYPLCHSQWLRDLTECPCQDCGGTSCTLLDTPFPPPGFPAYR
jgi:hypothetical protein